MAPGEFSTFAAAGDEAGAGLPFGSASLALPPDPAAADAVVEVDGAGGLTSLLVTSVAFRSSRADGFFGPEPSEAGFPVVFELSFLFVITEASLSCQRESLRPH